LRRSSWVDQATSSPGHPGATAAGTGDTTLTADPELDGHDEIDVNSARAPAARAGWSVPAARRGPAPSIAPRYFSSGSRRRGVVVRAYPGSGLCPGPSRRTRLSPAELCDNFLPAIGLTRGAGVSAGWSCSSRTKATRRPAGFFRRCPRQLAGDDPGPRRAVARKRVPGRPLHFFR